MIYSRLKDDFYDGLDEKTKLCFAKARTLGADTPTGRIDLSDDVYVNVMTYEPRPKESATAEIHGRYADIQLILDGEELIGIPVGETKEVQKYSEEKDIGIVSCPLSFVPMKKGDWCLFMPGEGHAPSVRDDASGCRQVKKAVFKIRYR